MIIEFTTGNYRSFYEPVTLSLEATRLSDHPENVFQSGRYSLLRSAAIFGANASGKSNLIQAMMFMRQFVLDSAKERQSGEPIDITRYALNIAAREEPASFQIVFLWDGKRYRYGFEVNEHRVLAEWLYQTEKREAKVFVRENQNFDSVQWFRKETANLEKHTRDNALFLSTVAQFNAPTAVSLMRWFREQFHGISGLNDKTFGGFTLHRFETDDKFRSRVRTLIQLADVGISDISVDTISLNDSDMPDDLRKLLQEIAQKEGKDKDDLAFKRVKAFHPVFRDAQQIGVEAFDLEEESKGTQKFFFLLGPLLDTLTNGYVLTIDELEARLHPLLTRAIVRLFNAPETNPHNAQLIFVTHDAGLLADNILRRDQVWFTEKDRYGATELYSLAEMKERNDASFGKNYLLGRYGAIPYIGNFQAFVEQEMQNG
jgi:AAA15 family ATPase/GTPase